MFTCAACNEVFEPQWWNERPVLDGPDAGKKLSVCDNCLDIHIGSIDYANRPSTDRPIITTDREEIEPLEIDGELYEQFRTIETHYWVSQIEVSKAAFERALAAYSMS